nr:hypothetical protein [Halovenus rubra]
MLVIAYSREARQTLRNICRGHEESVVRRFGRVVLLEETEFGAFLATRLRVKHGGDIQVERTAPFNEFDAVRPAVREAATDYESRETPSLPYKQFRSETDHPTSAEMKEQSL